MVEFTTERIAGKRRLARKCCTCKKVRWHTEYAKSTKTQCAECAWKVDRRRCKNCRGPAGRDTDGGPRKYCAKRECRNAQRRAASEKNQQRIVREMAKRKTKSCPNCLQNLPRTYEYFAPMRRNPITNEILVFNPYCRPCSNALRKDRYSTDERTRRLARERNAKRRRRMAEDPVFAAEQREKRLVWDRAYRARKRATATESNPVAALNSGPELPAGPLLEAIRVWMGKHEILSDEDASACLGVSTKRLREWRHQGSNTRLGIADQCLIAMDMLWFEIWDESEFPEVARIWEAA